MKLKTRVKKAPGVTATTFGKKKKKARARWGGQDKNWGLKRGGRRNRHSVKGKSKPLTGREKLMPKSPQLKNPKKKKKKQ